MDVKTLIWALGIALLSACTNPRRQEAALALDEARLAIAGARKAGADPLSVPRLQKAQAALSDAEALYADKDYAGAKTLALKADEEAVSAGSSLAARSSPEAN